jgi:hypothetical protein
MSLDVEEFESPYGRNTTNILRTNLFGHAFRLVVLEPPQRHRTRLEMQTIAKSTPFVHGATGGVSNCGLFENAWSAQAAAVRSSLQTNAHRHERAFPALVIVAKIRLTQRMPIFCNPICSRKVRIVGGLI